MTHPSDNITAAILTKNSAQTILTCLESVTWAKHILILDDHSTDNTIDIAQKFTNKILLSDQPNFAAKRNELLRQINTDWILYVDSDEVISKRLSSQILEIVKANQPAVYKIKRVNYFLNTKMYPDYVDRLFHKSTIKSWYGDVHESPNLTVSPQTLDLPIIHHTHTDITSMLEKTNHWSEFEADLRVKANHPPVAWWRLIRIMITEIRHQFVKLGVGRFGRNGIFEGYFQMIDKLIVYTKLWERQQKS